MQRSPRIIVTITEPERAWLSWYSAQTGRTLAAAAARLLSGAIEGEQAKPALARAYHEDQPAAGEPPPEVLREIAQAFSVAGVTQVLGGDRRGATDAALMAAGYLEAVSLWLMDAPARPRDQPPPRLADGHLPHAALGDIAGALAAWNGAGRPEAPTQTQGGASGVSDKRQLSDMAPPAQSSGRPVRR